MAVVGLGWWGQRVIQDLSDSASVVPVLAIDPSSAARAAVAESVPRTGADLSEALASPDVEAVVLCSPHRFHVEQVVATARASKHVFCEKPFASSVAPAEEALGAVADSGVVLGIGHERRFEPGVAEIRDLVASGRLGRLLAFEGSFCQDKFLALDEQNWRISATEAPVGPLSATGIHVMDLALSFLGEPDQASAHLSTQGTSFANGDTLGVQLRWTDGPVALLTAVLATPFLGRICLYGTDGWAELRDRAHPESPAGWDLVVSLRGRAPVTTWIPPTSAVRANLDAWATACLGGPGYPVSSAEILSNVRTYEAIVRSASSGNLVALRP